jgi:hypothetical protein
VLWRTEFESVRKQIEASFISRRLAPQVLRVHYQ